jgi:hypothetical protein
MFEWLMLLLTPWVPNAAPTETNYIGMVAAETAYSALLSGTTAVKPTPAKPVDPNCSTCKGAGKVPSGDGQGWTKCPTCQPTQMQPLKAAPVMKLQVQPLPPVKTSSCPDGKCPLSRT